MATCVFLGEDPRIDLNARFLAAIRHDDIGLIGQIRHVYAYDNGAGSSYLMLWSEGSLRLDQFLPQEGDAPGLDVPGLPRPDDSRRLLSGSHDGGDKQVNAYTSRRSVDELRAGYEAGLSRSGYRVLPLETASSTALMALRGERLLWISLVEYEGLGTVATVVGDATSDPPAPEEKAWN